MLNSKYKRQRINVISCSVLKYKVYVYSGEKLNLTFHPVFMSHMNSIFYDTALILSIDNIMYISYLFQAEKSMKLFKQQMSPSSGLFFFK